MLMPTTLLVIEDDTIAREGLGVILRREGYEVLLAANGEEGLAALRSLCPDLILLDMLMPVLDGWHFLERLNAGNPPSAIPVIVVTSAPLSLEWADAHGCCGFIPKPIDPGKMLEEIRRCLEESEE